MRLARFSALLVTAAALAAAPVIAIAAGGGPVKGAKYTGSSGAGYPMSFKVSVNGKAVDNLVVAYLDSCQPGAGNVAPKFHFSTLTIKARKFFGTSTDHFGKTVTDKLSISGAFSGREATGKVKDLAHIKSLPNCTDTSPFTAKAK